MITLKYKRYDSVGSTHVPTLPARDISIELQYYLEDEIQRKNILDPVVPADFLNILLSSKKSIPSDRGYLNRIAQVAYERYTARRITHDAPTITIVPVPFTKQQTEKLLGDRLNYVVIFGAESIYFQDTVHALAVDSYYSGGVNVLGVDIDWISPSGESVERAIIVDETGLVKEVALEESVPIHIVQILHLPLKSERQIHRKLSIQFHDRGILQINPYADSSERADDKSWTHNLWNQWEQEIEFPKYTLIPQGSSQEEIFEILNLFAKKILNSDLVVQTNRGTEGHKVEKFFVGKNLKTPSTFLPIVKYIIDQILPEDDAIVRERRGNVRYRDAENHAPNLFVNVSFRINVAWNGSAFAAESGYAQVAKDDKTFPASRGRSGNIVDINKALANLYYLRGGRWTRLILRSEDIKAMETAAIRAAHALIAGLNVENYLKLMGIDILMEVKEQKEAIFSVIPVVLEANSRPAGLSHSSEIVGISDKKPQPRISKEIFRFLVSKARNGDKT